MDFTQRPNTIRALIKGGDGMTTMDQSLMARVQDGSIEPPCSNRAISKAHIESRRPTAVLSLG